jgi:hypothetical protein
MQAAAGTILKHYVTRPDWKFNIYHLLELPEKVLTLPNLVGLTQLYQCIGKHLSRTRIKSVV